MLLGAVIAFIALQLWAALLIVLRAKIFETRLYRPMLLNLGLSLVPLVLQIAFVSAILAVAALFHDTEAGPLAARGVQLLGLIGLFTWALLFPNASYLITELNFSHVREDEPVPQYYDIIMVFTLAATGFVNALVSLSVFQFILLLVIDPPSGEVPVVTWAIVIAYALASSFAIYLGRHVRVNSWDVLHPWQFGKRLWHHFGDPAARRTAAGYTAFFSGTLIISHVMVFSVMYTALVARA